MTIHVKFLQGILARFNGYKEKRIEMLTSTIEEASQVEYLHSARTDIVEIMRVRWLNG